MDHLAHEKLIAALAAKLAEPVPPEGFKAPYFQAAWALIKKIGPTFKIATYPKRSGRDAAWTKFQTAVEELKRRQKVWEARSTELQAEVLAAIERSRPPGVSMAQLLAPAPTAKTAAPARATVPVAPTAPAAKAPSASAPGPAVATATPAPAAEAPLTERARRRAELMACATAAAEALRTFNAVKHQLSHAHFQVVSRELREVRAQVDAAWARFKTERSAPTATGGARGRAAAWRKVVAARQRKLAAAIENDEACLSSKQQAVDGFRKLLTQTAAEKERARLQGWIEKESAAIAELEQNLAALRARLAAAEQQLAAAAPVENPAS